MKYSLLLVASIALLMGACRKKADRINCYSCYTKDSIWSVVPELNNPYAKFDSGYRCGVSEDQINYITRQAAAVDTIYNSADSTTVKYHSMSCTVG